MSFYLSTLDELQKLSYGKEWEHTLQELHRVTPESTVDGRNIIAGYTRAQVLASAKLGASIEKDPVYQESLSLARDRSLLMDVSLMNLFLIMKYGIEDRSGDIIEFGSYRGGSALFIANVARRLGFTGKVYALDTFSGMPAVDDALDLHPAGDFGNASFNDFVALIQEKNFSNLIPMKGLFEETVPSILLRKQPVILAHIDCDIYSSVKYAISSLWSHMHPAGGYLVFDDPLNPSCIGALQAVEELLQEQGFRAEQAYPHLVYRVPLLTEIERIVSITPRQMRV